MDPSGDGVGGPTATGLICGSCGTELPPNSKFCNECGAPLTQATRSAEYKQVTILFADVVHSMDIAAAVGAERLREIMTELVNRAAVVVQRYGGTVDKFTGDGIMAVFGAPVALEDHAIRACMVALGVQQEAERLAVDLRERDGVDLRLRVGLNSGQVIAGEIGSGSFGYTAVGEHVGMAQRMESVAAPGGVMLSASTARLLDGAAVLGEPEMVRIKGAKEQVSAHRLLGMGERHRAVGRAESNLVGRQWEMAAAEGLLDRAVDGHGAVVALVGSPGIGKSRVSREIAALAAARGVDVFTAYCESHATDIPFYVVARLLRAATGVDGLDPQVARDRVRDRVPDADPEDMLLFDDLLGIADLNAPLPAIDPDARRRRLTALVNAASLARQAPTVYVVEDAHWIDEVSESMIADFLTVIPQTPSLMLLTYRPEYRGALTRVADAQTIAVAPLRDSETVALIGELLGPDPSVGGLGKTVAERAAGNPFFAEEIVRELAERGVLRGQPGGYVSTAEGAEVSVPATLQATIAARIDRLDPKAKRTLSAAAVVGSRFGLDLLAGLGVEPVVADLVAAQLIDQVRFTRQPEYVFHHPLIRAVAYESQLISDRAETHRRLAAAIESRDPTAAEENAALIAEHLAATGDLHAAYGWHMRAATWSTNRDIAAAQLSWERARQVADQVPSNDPEYAAMRIAPRTLLCGVAWRRFHPDISARFEELQQLCAEADDKASLAIGMTGLVVEQLLHARIPEASRLASECMAVIESIGDPTLTVGLSVFAIVAKIEAGELTDALRWSQAVIDVAGGDSAIGTFVFGSPLAGAHMLRGIARWITGNNRWREDLDWAVELAHEADPLSHAAILRFKYSLAIPRGVLLADDAALRDIEAALKFAERSSDDVALVQLRMTLGIMLVHHDSADLERGFDVLAQVRATCIEKRFGLNVVPVLDLYLARQRVADGGLDGAVTQLRVLTEDLFNTGHIGVCDLATATFVEALLARGSKPDMGEAQAAMERLESLPVNFSWAVRDITVLRLRALLARANGDVAAYAHFRDRYRAMARTLGFEGHMKWAEAMP